MAGAANKSTSVLWLVVAGVVSTLVMLIPLWITALMISVGWSGCLVDCTEGSATDPGLFWSSLGEFILQLLVIGSWTATGWMRFPRRWVLISLGLLLVSWLLFLFV